MVCLLLASGRKLFGGWKLNYPYDLPCPDDLPFYLEYRVGEVVLPVLCRRKVETHGSSGKTDACIVHPQIPFGADAVRRVGGPWRELKDLPKAWMPWLDRARPSPGDPRAKARFVPVDAIQDEVE